MFLGGIKTSHFPGDAEGLISQYWQCFPSDKDIYVLVVKMSSSDMLDLTYTGL